MSHLSISNNSVCRAAIRDRNIDTIIECIHYKIKHKYGKSSNQQLNNNQKLIDILQRIMSHLSIPNNSVCNSAIQDNNIDTIIECIHYKIKNKWGVY